MLYALVSATFPVDEILSGTGLLQPTTSNNNSCSMATAISILLQIITCGLSSLRLWRGKKEQNKERKKSPGYLLGGFIAAAVDFCFVV